MLNSLVRVSRRVGGVADLLATEMQPVPTRTLVIRDHSSTRRRQGQEPGAEAPKRHHNFTQALGSPTTVRCVRRQRSAGADRANNQPESLQISEPEAAPPSP